MGRRVKPTNLKLVENSRDRRPKVLARAEPVPDGSVQAPDWFTDDQRSAWDFAVSSAPYGLLKRIDSELLVSWAIAVDLRRQAATKLSHSSLLIRDKNGNVATSPYVRIINQQTVILKAMAAELGFSPAARTGIALEPEYVEHSADRFFK